MPEMNKFQKSLDRIKSNVPLHEDSWTDEDKEHVITIMEALEKQIPKRPNKIGYPIDSDTDPLVYGYCPCCNTHRDSSKGYCDKCGQALDWSDTE